MDDGFERLITVSIQGGGVFGLSLLGQLAGLLDSQQQQSVPVSLAGASAGSIIVTLYWAGLSPKEIMDELHVLLVTKQLLSLIESETSPDRFSMSDLRSVIRLTTEFKNIAQSFASNKSAGRLSRISSYIRILMSQSSLIRLFKSIDSRGLFAGENFTKWFDRILLERLNRDRAALGLGNLQPGSRPRFEDYFALTDVCRAPIKVRPLLMLTVANLSRKDLLVIDSHSQAFQHLVVSDVVRASISFPGFFQPKELDIWRDIMSGEPADSSSLQPVNGRPGAFLSREVFVDGGVAANFPSWLTLDLAREIMWGRNLKGNYVRLGKDEAFGRIEQATTEVEGRQAPLRHHAFRPMVHFGLQLVEDQGLKQQSIDRSNYAGQYIEQSNDELRTAETYWGQLGTLISGTSRGRLENKLLNYQIKITNSRYHDIVQSISESAWPHGVMRFDMLSLPAALRMYDAGFVKGKMRGQEITYSFPLSSEIRIKSVNSIASELVDLLKECEVRLLGRLNDLGFKCEPKLFVSCLLVEGDCEIPLLVEKYRMASTGELPTAESFAVQKLNGDIEQPELHVYHSRMPQIFRRDSSWLNGLVSVDRQGGVGETHFRYAQPIFDNREIRTSILEFSTPELLLSPEQQVVERDADHDAFVLGSKKPGIIFGILKVDLILLGNPQDGLIRKIWQAAATDPSVLVDPYFAKMANAVSDLWSERFGAVDGSSNHISQIVHKVPQ